MIFNIQTPTNLTSVNYCG